MPVLNPNALITDRVEALRTAHEKAGVTKAELDISGGIDSAVMACLLIDSLGPENVILVHSGMSTNPVQTARARSLASKLNCPMIHVDLSNLYEQFISLASAAIVQAHDTATLGAVNDRCAADKTILGAIRSTLRAPVGRAFNRMLGGGIRHGTGNECEDRFLRFYQKGGDGEVDSNPLAMLSKSEVYQLAFAIGKHLNCEAEMRVIIEATPSPDLWGEGDGHSDEAELLSWTGVPFTYGRIDPWTGGILSVGTIERVSRLLDLNTNFVSIEGLVFGESEPDWEHLIQCSHLSGLFKGFMDSEIEQLLRAARKAERYTRHKENPNCPTYGSRRFLVAEGIITNDLSVF